MPPRPGFARRRKPGRSETGQLGPGEILLFDRTTGTIQFSEEIKESLAAQAPYEEWIGTETFYVQQPFDAIADDRFDAGPFCRVFGYTPEERRVILAEMAEGKTPTGSMGNDSALAALAEEPRRLTQYLHQLFAQVTNPPMDPIREQLVMSLRTYMGRRASMLSETNSTAHIVELSSPILSDAELSSIVRSSDPELLLVLDRRHLALVEGARRDGPPPSSGSPKKPSKPSTGGASLIVLSDREVDADNAPIPMVLVVGAIHHALIEAGIRIKASMIVVSGEPRDSHDLAMLIAAGASAVNPYLAIDQVRALAEEGVVNVDPVVAQENYRSALQSGLLKVMSKMGICTVSAYRGSELFEVIGLGEDVCDLSFRNAPRRFIGLSLDQVAGRVLELHSRYREGEEFAGGFYKHRGKGQPSHHRPGSGPLPSESRAIRCRGGLGPLRRRRSSTDRPRSSAIFSSSPRGPRCRSRKSSPPSGSCAGSWRPPCRTGPFPARPMKPWPKR